MSIPLENATLPNHAQDKHAGHVVLIAEDDANDLFLLKKLLKERTPFKCSIRSVRDGLEAIEYFSGENGFRDREKYPAPDMLLTDLKMPRVDGVELLRWIRNQPDLKSLPVVIITGSSLEPHEVDALVNAATAFMSKEVAFRSPQKLFKTICDFVPC